MNELSEIFSYVSDGETIKLTEGKAYHVSEEDSYRLSGYHCSNTAHYDENPDGRFNAAIYLKNRHDIEIDGQGASIIVHGKMTPFIFDSCRRITVRNLTVDYACPTMAEFTVMSNHDGRCRLLISRGTRFRVDGSVIYWIGEDSPDGRPYWEYRADGPKQFTEIFDPATERSHLVSSALLSFSSVEYSGGRELTVTVKNKEDFVPGTVFQTRNIVRDQTGALLERCTDLRFENLRIKFMHGLGMVSQFCENVSYINCDLTPGEGRTITSTADFFQFSGCRGLIELKNCHARGAHDDFANIHGTHLQIVESDSDSREITVRFMHGESWGFRAFEKADRIEFIHWDTLIPYAEAIVEAYERLSCTDIRLTLDRPLPEGIVIGHDVVENATWTPDVHIEGCDLDTIVARGILCTTRGKVLIENNRFYHLRYPALLVEDDCNFWFESGYTNHIIFRNNEIIGCSYDGGYPDHPAVKYSPKVMNENSEEFVHKRLSVYGNTFREAEGGKHVFNLRYLADTEITDNTFDAPYYIDAKKCGRIIDRDNTVLPEEK